MNYLKLFGYKNLLLIAVAQLLIHYFFFQPFQVDISFNGLGIGLFVFSTLCLAAAGNCIIAVYNREADELNHPKKTVVGKSISEKTALNLFIVLNVIAVGIGFYLSNGLGYPQFSALYIIVSGLLYLYATYLKKQLVIGNLILAVLAALVSIGMGLFELMPMITPQNQATQNTIFSILLDYAVFAFLMVWLREILCGQINIDGDHKVGNETLSIKLGKERTNKILFGLGLITLAAVLFYMYEFLFQKQAVVLYCLALVIAPLIFFLVKIPSAKSQKDFSRLKLVLDIVLWFGMLSIGLYRFVLLE
jgi:4-hydroxybenzoate polyprenyltransferase